MDTLIGDDRPYVIVHTAVSLDGSASGFQPDLAQFYSLAAEWQEDATLTGADTILAQEAELAHADLPGPNQGGPLLAVVDSKCRVTAWNALRDVGYWSRVIALRSIPSSLTSDVEEIVTGGQHVDLAAALAELRTVHSVRIVRGQRRQSRRCADGRTSCRRDQPARASGPRRRQWSACLVGRREVPSCARRKQAQGAGDQRPLGATSVLDQHLIGPDCLTQFRLESCRVPGIVAGPGCA